MDVLLENLEWSDLVDEAVPCAYTPAPGLQSSTLRVLAPTQ